MVATFARSGNARDRVSHISIFADLVITADGDDVVIDLGDGGEGLPVYEEEGFREWGAPAARPSRPPPSTPSPSPPP